MRFYIIQKRTICYYFSFPIYKLSWITVCIYLGPNHAPLIGFLATFLHWSEMLKLLWVQNDQLPFRSVNSLMPHTSKRLLSASETNQQLRKSQSLLGVKFMINLKDHSYTFLFEAYNHHFNAIILYRALLNLTLVKRIRWNQRHPLNFFFPYHLQNLTLVTVSEAWPWNPGADITFGENWSWPSLD